MKQLLFIISMCIISSAIGVAQTSLNIHQKNGGIVCYSFSAKPKLTYVEDLLHVSTDEIEIDYPISELEKLTFDNDTPVSINTLCFSGESAKVYIYRMNGSLLDIKKADINNPATIDTSELPSGTYLVKQGSVTIKIIKQ